MIKFGTDGWRAVIARDFTFENVKKVAQAYVMFLKSKPRVNVEDKVAVGYDTRFLSDKFAQEFCQVLAGNKVKSFILNSPLPTPCLCFVIKKYKLSGGIMVTASHNPPEFNGIKIKTENGGPATQNDTRKIESLVGKYKIKEIPYERAKAEGLIEETDYKYEYLTSLKRYFDFNLVKTKRLKILHDAMFGTGNHLLLELFKGSRIKVDTIRGERNPSFGGISPEPIPKNLISTIKIMKSKFYDICLITDGDGDRIGAILPNGKFLHPGMIMALLLLHFIRNRKESGCVVKTISNSSLIEKIAQRYKLKLYETGVGFKNIARIMQSKDVLIGGEESGGIGFKNYIPERDGLLAGLLLLEMMVYEDKGIIQIVKEVEKEFGKFYYQRIDLHYPDTLKGKLFKKLHTKPFREINGKRIKEIKDYDGIKFIFQDDSWLLFRLSGTEPILRIYCEASSLNRVNKMLSLGRKFAYSLIWKDNL